MTPTVHILATCTNPALLPSTLLVFDTLHIGFPNAAVKVHGNHLVGEAAGLVFAAATAAGAEYQNSDRERIHGGWMRQVVDEATGPVVFLDTDVVFWAAVEGWQFETGLAGRYIRRFRCPFTRCVTEPRLHTSLLFVDPERLRAELAAHQLSFHESRFNPRADLWRAVTVPERTRAGVVNHFHDTACLAYQAVGGTSFTEDQLGAYDHLHAGTWADELDPAVPGLLAGHAAVWQDRNAARGLWRQQNDWFAQHAC